MEVSLNEIGEIITGNTPSKSDTNFWDSPDICFIKPDVIAEDEITELLDSNEYISENARNKARIVNENSILVTCIGSIAKIGIVKIRECAFNQQINAIIPDKNIDTKYLCYCLQNSKVKLKAIANAPVVPIINKKQFGEFVVKIDGDISIQKKIANRLDHIQSVIKLYKIQLRKFDDLIKARFVEMFGDPSMNLHGLELLPMARICEIIDGDRGKNYPNADDFTDDGFCLFLNAKNVTALGFDFSTCTFITKEKDSALRKGKLSRGDVVLTTRGTIGNLAFYTGEVPYDNIRINSGMVILRMKQNVMDELFFIEQFKMQLKGIKEKIASGSAQPQLPISVMNKIQILVPNIKRQKEFELFVKQVDKSRFDIKKSITELEREVVYD